MRGGAKAVKRNKMKNQHPVQAVQTTPVSREPLVGVKLEPHSALWRPRVETSNGETELRGLERRRAAGGGVRSYRAKAERVEIGHEGFWVNVLQIPREALAVQPCAEVQALGDIAEGPLRKQRREKN